MALRLSRQYPDLPSMLHDRGFRSYARTLKIPLWPENRACPEDLPELRLYYIRVGFLASAYINQVGEEPATVLPTNLATPLCRACKLLKRPPILSYDGYALYNWKRFRKDQPIALGNIDTIQNFVHLYDEHWFILIHVEIEALAARILDSIAKVQTGLSTRELTIVNDALWAIAGAVSDQVKVLRRIPEKMDPALYYKTFRPSYKPVVRFKSFVYQAASWTIARRVVAKVEFHCGELFPRVGFIVTNLGTSSRAVVRFYNKRGTADAGRARCRRRAVAAAGNICPCLQCFWG